MYLREQQGLELAGAAGSARMRALVPSSRMRALVPAAAAREPFADQPLLDQLRDAVARTDWVPDLGQDIGSRTWWRGAATCVALIAAAWTTRPDRKSVV